MAQRARPSPRKKLLPAPILGLLLCRGRGVQQISDKSPNSPELTWPRDGAVVHTDCESQFPPFGSPCAFWHILGHDFGSLAPSRFSPADPMKLRPSPPIRPFYFLKRAPIVVSAPRACHNFQTADVLTAVITNQKKRTADILTAIAGERANGRRTDKPKGGRPDAWRETSGPESAEKPGKPTHARSRNCERTHGRAHAHRRIEGSTRLRLSLYFKSRGREPLNTLRLGA